MEEIKKAIEQSGLSRYRISRDTKVDNSVLFKIVNNGVCSIKTADILMKYFNLEIVQKKR